MDPLTVFGASAVASGVGSLIGYHANKSLQEDSQNFAREQMAEQNKLNNENQLRAASNAVQGYKLAGLNPALASAGNFSPAQVSQGSAGMASAPVPDFNVLGALTTSQQLQNMKAQENLTKAQEDNVKADTALKNNEVRNIEDFNQTLQDNLPRLFNELANDYRLDDDTRHSFAKAAHDVTAEGVSKGSVDGLYQYLQLREREKMNLVNEAKSDFDWHLVYSQLKDPSVISALATMPVAQRNQMLTLSAQYMSQVSHLAQLDETERGKQDLIRSQIVKTTREAQAILHSDKAQMSKEGDIHGLFWSIGGQLVNRAASMK